MKICIFHPNMHLMGGGEMVALTIASALRNGHQVTVLVTRPVDVKRLQTFFGLPLGGVEFRVFGWWITRLPTFPSLKPSLYVRTAYALYKGFDLVLDTCSNGLFDRKLPQNTICYVHFPNYTKPKKGLKALLNPFLIKEKDMFCYDKIVCNSKFTQSHVKKLTSRKTIVIYPPVMVEKIKPAKRKQDLIISIGRFSPEKKFEVLIEAFKKLESKASSYSLHLVGAYRGGDERYFRSLESAAKGHRIIFHKNMPHDDLLKFLGKCRIYWHARGYGETDPVEYENFGITTVEAMAAGCVPIVINLGAQSEIIRLSKSGHCWDEPSDLVKKTVAAIDGSERFSSPLPGFFLSSFFIKRIRGLL